MKKKRMLLDDVQNRVIWTLKNYPKEGVANLNVFNKEHLQTLLDKSNEQDEYEVAAIIKKELDSRS